MVFFIHLASGLFYIDCATTGCFINTMWRGAPRSICSKLLLSPRAACGRTSDAVLSLSGSHFLSSPVIGDVLPQGALFSTQFNSSSVAGSWKLGPTPASHGLDVESPVEVPFLRSPVATFLASKKLSKASDSALHYGRCYWELSKAKLRCCSVSSRSCSILRLHVRALEITWALLFSSACLWWRHLELVLSSEVELP